jgi:signal transduction histidine kinase/DNA-binding response OmpR family regulator/ligand-binding sensor domain-containing protein
VENGLSSRRVFQIAKDSSGFMWFFTYAGIDRYDGSEIKHYRLSGEVDIEESSLYSSKMVCDKDKNIWISVRNGKIFSYNKLLDKFIFQVDLASFLPGQEILLNSIMFDRENRLWLCMSTGLYLFDLARQQLMLINDFQGESVSVIEQGKGHTYYIGTHRHVYYMEEGMDDSMFRPSLFDVETRVESLHFHREKLYVGTFSDGLYIIDIGEKQATHMDNIPGVPIREIKSTSDDHILVGLDGSGVYVFDAINSQLIRKYLPDEDNNTSLRGNTVCDIFVDECNRIWIGTSTNGISILDPLLPDVTYIRHEQRNDNSLISSHVNVVFEDSDGDIWYGTNTGVSMFSSGKKQWRHFINDKNKAKVVLALCEDADKGIWVGGFGIKTHRIDKQTGKIQSLPTRQDSGLSGISSNYIYSIYADNRYVWLGGIEGDLTRYDIRTKEYQYYDITCIGDIKPVNDSILSIASCAGLVLFNKKNDSYQLFTEFDGTSLNCPIRSVYPVSMEEIWMATDGKGLIRFDFISGNTLFFSLEDGLASNSILGLLQDNKKRIWFSSESGLYYIDPQSDTPINIGEYIGLEGENYNANACVRRKNGNLIFGTANGAMEIAPDFNIDNDYPTKLVFTDFKLFYKSSSVDTPDSPLEKAIDETTFISLKYVQNSFSFSFSSINFTQPHTLQYQCKLDGFENEWHDVGNKNIGYTNINPGKYDFKLRVINKYTQKVLDERNIGIAVQKPWWASWWALTIYLVILTGIAFFVFQYIKNRMERQSSREKINFFIDVAHDIRTPVALIKAPLSELENEELSDSVRKTLSMAIKNAEKLFSLVTQLLDFQKVDRAMVKLSTSINELHAYMTEKIASFDSFALKKNIRLTMDADFDYLQVCFDRNNMNKIIDNLLSNAIKYTPENGVVEVILKHTNDQWSVEVKDSGIGIPLHEQKNLFRQFYRAGNAVNSKETGSGIGLLLTQKLVKMHHGDIQFTSVENEGSSFKVNFPIGNTTNPENERISVIGQNEETSGSIKVSKEKILLVEDNDDMRAYLKTSLSQEYQVIDMSDGRQVLEQVSTINPDIIISDVVMPYLRGDEMCRMLKSSMETSHIPVILLTALTDKENIIMGLESGADDYVTKPFDSSVLKARIRNILQNREKLRKAVSSGNLSTEEINYPNELDKEFIDRAIALINDEMSNPEFSINDFCQSMAMSRSSIYNKIKTLTGQAPNDFIRIIRLNKAQELLKSRKYNISEVSTMIGFSDPKYFSTSFKKQFGISPSKYLDKI